MPRGARISNVVPCPGEELYCVSMENPINGEVVAALTVFVRGGSGPSHSSLTSALLAAGIVGLTPYSSGSFDSLSKVDRITEAACKVWQQSTRGRRLVEEILSIYRVAGIFGDPNLQMEVASLRSALLQRGWALDTDGRLDRLGDIDLEVGDRQALNDQLNRLRHNTEDAGLLLGTAKELLESVGKFVLEENGRLPDRRINMPEVMTVSMELLGIMPVQVDASTEGGKQLRKVYQAVRTVVDAINELRNDHGTGHGRTLPSGVSVEAARFMIRQATMVAEMMLATHDRQMGRA